MLIGSALIGRRCDPLIKAGEDWVMYLLGHRLSFPQRFASGVKNARL